MNHIILAIDPEKTQPQAVDFAIYLAGITGSKLTGMFMQLAGKSHEPGLKFVLGGAYVETIDRSVLPETKLKNEASEMIIADFVRKCEQKQVNSLVHRAYGSSVAELLTESRYADLLIIATEAFSDNALSAPGDFVRTVLHEAACPVIMAPEHPFAGIEEIFWAFGNEDAALFAIRQFAYLFPGMKDVPLTVLHASQYEGLTEELKAKVYEMLRTKFELVYFRELYGKADEALFDFLLRKQNALLVTGAYGRGKLSQFFKHSTADLPAKISNIPFFIAHC